MKMSSNEYDAVIIGAGIGGLVCGCYLAKAGMKVLIAEQHNKPGGYCTSFKRGNFTFDAAPHCFGSYREGGMLRKIFSDIGIDKKLNIIRANPSDIIITPNYKINIWNNMEETIEDFSQHFPDYRDKIKQLFYLLVDTNPSSFSNFRNINFRDLLNYYLKNEILKEIIALPLLAIIGLPSSKISAFVGAKLYSEFLFDGGYYPAGGMQVLPDTLAMTFIKFGGELRLSCLVNKIIIKDNKVKGIILEKNEIIQSKYVISNCDARQTFLKLLGRKLITDDFYNKLISMIPSMSNFILYLGLDKNFQTSLKTGSAHYFFNHYSSEFAYKFVKKGDFKKYGGFAFRVSHDKSSIYAGMPAPFKNKSFWGNNKYHVMNAFIDRIEKYIMPDLSKHIIYKDAATPYTMYRYTLNYRGAAYGWLSVPSQLIIPEFKKPPFIKNLYMVGHWTTYGIGISGAAYVGYDTAKLISKNNDRQNNKNLII